MRPSIFTTSEGRNTRAFGPAEWGLLLVAAAVFGSSFLLMAIGLDAFAPGLITLLRIFFGFLALSLLPASRRPIDREDWPRTVLIGVTWFAAPLSFYPLAQQHIDSSVAGMLNGATPLFAALVATSLLGRMPGPRQQLGILIGLTGMVMIGVPSLGKGSSSALGVLLVIGAVSCYGLAFNIAVPLQQKYGSLPVLWRAQMVAIVLTLPGGLLGLGDSRMEADAMAAVAILGIFGTGLAYFATASLSGRVGSTRGSVVTYLATPVSMVLGVVFRSESLAGLAIVGAFVTLAGAWTTSRADTAAR